MVGSAFNQKTYTYLNMKKGEKYMDRPQNSIQIRVHKKYKWDDTIHNSTVHNVSYLAWLCQEKIFQLLSLSLLFIIHIYQLYIFFLNGILVLLIIDKNIIITYKINTNMIQMRYMSSKDNNIQHTQLMRARYVTIDDVDNKIYAHCRTLE